mgnify:CR=1 FL=1|tara:strand:- start:6190 stop:6567 length:378 start_codon:yes stop_codon:yes gene_type:complete
MNIPENLKYTKDHEWIVVDGDTATIGITDFAQSELGDIVFVEVDTEGETLESEEVFGTVEAVKTVSDLFMPLKGKVIEFNKNLEDSPELINSSPYEDGWIIKSTVSDVSEIDNLLSAEEYKNLIS